VEILDDRNASSRIFTRLQGGDTVMSGTAGMKTKLLSPDYISESRARSESVASGPGTKLSTITGFWVFTGN